MHTRKFNLSKHAGVNRKKYGDEHKQFYVNIGDTFFSRENWMKQTAFSGPTCPHTQTNAFFVSKPKTSSSFIQWLNLL